jgi:hypothetical protein
MTSSLACRVGIKVVTLTYANNIPLTTLLHFGLYDVILSQWDGKIKVVSSMGKQTCGNSYLLNHMVGSLLDVIKGRCIKWSVDDGLDRFKVLLCIDGIRGARKF